jgi:3-dehydroquinate synthetase
MLVDASIEPLLASALTIYTSSEPVDQWKMIDLIARSAAVKLDIVAADPREANQRMLLNLGHTFAHAIESQFSSELLHGEAVALGLVAAAAASAASGRMTVAGAASVRDRVAALGFQVKLPQSASIETLEKAAGFDKKRLGGALTLILPKTGGGADIVRQADPELLRIGLRSIDAVDAE